MACREISQIFRDAGTEALVSEGNHASVIAGQVVKKVQATAENAAYIASVTVIFNLRLSLTASVQLS